MFACSLHFIEIDHPQHIKYLVYLTIRKNEKSQKATSFLARLHEVQRAIVVTSVVRVPVPVPVTLRQIFLEVHSLATTNDRGFKLGP